MSRICSDDTGNGCAVRRIAAKFIGCAVKEGFRYASCRTSEQRMCQINTCINKADGHAFARHHV